MSDMIEIGILGMGNIGSEFVEILQKQTADIEQASNKKIQEIKIVPEILKFLFSSKGFAISSKYMILIILR